jgi:polyisoprenoid-binding protein YceI
MMQADRYPQLVFTSSKVLAKGPDQYDVEGSLTIRGVAKPIVVHVTKKPGAFEGEATVKLSDFGLKPPTGVTLGFIGTKDEMKVLFRLIPKPR